MPLINWLASLFCCPRSEQQPVSNHTKHQAYGPRWSHHRPRHIGGYSRRSPRRRRR